MDPLSMGLITGGASLLSGIFSSNTSAQNTQANILAQQQMQNQTQQFNAQQAQLNRDFQSTQSSTAYQRASQDMKSAGLNPMMMFGSGSPASVPSGSTASVGTPNMALSNNVSPLANLGDAASKAVTTAVAAKSMDKLTEETANLQAERLRIKALTDTEAKRPAYVEAQTDETRSRSLNIQQDTTAKKLDRARQEFEAIKYLDLSGLPDPVRKTGNIAGWMGDRAGQVLDPLSSAVGSARTFQQFSKLRKPQRSTEETTTNKSNDGTTSFKERFQY